MTRGRMLAWTLLAVGLTAIVGQVLLMRELVATLYGNELLFGLILAAWLGWGAIGAALALSGQRAAWRTRALAAGLAAAAVLLPAQLTLARGLRTLLGATPGSVLDLAPLLLAVVLILAPLCLCLGALFSIGARLAVEGARTPGWAYFWDSIGSVAGGVLFSFVFVRWLNPFQTAFLVTGLDLAVAVLWTRCAAREHSERRRSATNGIEPSGGWTHAGDKPAAWSWRGSSQAREALNPRCAVTAAGAVAALATLVILAAAAFPLGRAAQTATLRLEWPDAISGTAQSLLFSGDSPYGRLAVQARGSQRIFYTDGLLAFETQSTFPEEVAHLPLLAHPAPRDVLLIGGGIAGDLREILKHPVDSVTYVELDPLLIRAAREHLPAADAAILDAPRVRLVMTDGRAFVAESATRYDVIIMDLPEPTTGALNRFYTEEFFAQARQRLRPGGILSFGLPSAENYWNPELAQRNASVARTLGSIFPNVTVLPGEHDFFLAGSEPIVIDPGILSERLAQRNIQTRWVTPAFLQDLFTGDRFAAAQDRVRRETGVRINRDLSPLSYTYSLAHWLARFYPGLRGAFESAGAIHLWWLAVPLVLAVLIARWRRPWSVPLMVAGVGLAQMLLELVLLFAFQALHGSLYVEVGLIVTAFMGGLALGAAGGNRILGIADWRQRAPQFRALPIADLKTPLPRTSLASDPGTLDRIPGPNRRKFHRWALIGVLAGMAIYSAALLLLFTAAPPHGGIPQLAFPALALIGGALGGMVFPLASVWRIADGRRLMADGVSLPAGQSAIRDPQSAIGGILYAADLAGGCLGALLGAALFIPILGIPQTCAMIALLAVAGLLAIM